MSQYAVNPHHQNKLIHINKFPFIDLDQLKKVLIFCHKNTDPDSYCSAYSIADLLESLVPNVQISIISPNGFNLLTKKILKKFKKKILKSPILSNYDLIVIVDTGEISLLGKFAEKLAFRHPPKIFIDHHPLVKSSISISDFIIVDTNVTSCSEIIYYLFKSTKIPISKEIANVLLMGILFDSQNLTLANNNTVKIVSELCKKGASLRESRDFLILPKNTSEILSYIKAVKRIKAYQVKNSIMIFTRINSYQDSIANILLDLGADISLAIGEKEDGIRGSLRSTQSFYKETNLHLGMDVAYMVASKLGGHGGGHPKAASFTVPKSLEKTMENIIHIIQTKLGVTIKEINS